MCTADIDLAMNRPAVLWSDVGASNLLGLGESRGHLVDELHVSSYSGVNSALANADLCVCDVPAVDSGCRCNPTVTAGLVDAASDSRWVPRVWRGDYHEVAWATWER